MFFQLAWRNIWRNPRRTIVILIAIIIGVWCMIFLGALMRGFEDEMIRNGISTLTGHIQVMTAGYRTDPVVENCIQDMAAIDENLGRVLPADSRWTPRIQVSAIAANARHSTGLVLVGIDPPREQGMSFLSESVKDGNYLEPDDSHGIIIGQSLADKLETEIGKKLVLMTQDAEQEIGSRAFRIQGIFQATLEATEKQYVFVTLPAARALLKLEQGVSYYSIMLADRSRISGVIDQMRRELPASVTIWSWQELLPLVQAYQEMNAAFIWLWYVVVFVAMGFGVVNTTLMAIYERMREFGLFKALGMKPVWIIKDVLIESGVMLCIGIIMGTIIGLLTVAIVGYTGIDLSAVAEGSEYFGMGRVLYPSTSVEDVLVANLIVLGLGLLVSLYPAIKASRFTPTEALRQT